MVRHAHHDVGAVEVLRPYPAPIGGLSPDFRLYQHRTGRKAIAFERERIERLAREDAVS
jgi:hypothetical protein